MKNGAVYIRVSTDDQVEYSPEAQLKKIKEYAKQHDILITSEYTYIENGVSGRTVEKREQFKKMIATAKIKPKPFDVVLIHAYDRFARNVKESRIYKELLRDDLGIELISITEDFGSGKNSFLMEGIKDILNEYYSLNLRDEVLKGMNEKASRGELQTGASYGYKVVNNKLEILEEEADVVKLIYDKYANTNDNITDITRYINSLGIKTKRGNLFETRTIRYILYNPVYIGKLRWSNKGRLSYHTYNSNKDSIITDSKHEPIIDYDTWNKVQSKLEKNYIFAKPHQCNSNKDVWHWLKGLVKCNYCNHTYVKIYGGKSLRCNGYNKGLCSNNMSIQTKLLESIVLEQIKFDFESPIQLNVKPIKSDENIKKDILNKKIKQLEIKFDRIKEAYMNGVDTLEEYKTNKLLIQKEINSVKSELKIEDSKKIKTKSNIKINIKNVYQSLVDEKISNEIKKEAIKELINQVIIDPDTEEIFIEYNE